MNGQVYYLHKTGKGVGELYKASSSGQDQLLLEENVRAATIQDGYLLCMLEHAEDYGFVLRYPEDKEDITGIMYEPWHFRYVGVEHAKKMNELHMCLEEYIEYVRSQQS